MLVNSHPALFEVQFYGDFEIRLSETLVVGNDKDKPLVHLTPEQKLVLARLLFSAPADQALDFETLARACYSTSGAHSKYAAAKTATSRVKSAWEPGLTAAGIAQGELLCPFLPAGKAMVKLNYRLFHTDLHRYEKLLASTDLEAIEKAVEELQGKRFLNNLRKKVEEDQRWIKDGDELHSRLEAQLEKIRPSAHEAETEACVWPLRVWIHHFKI